MIVGVTGSRDWADPGAIRRGLVLAQHGGSMEVPGQLHLPESMRLIHGQCPPRTERGAVISWGRAKSMPYRQKIRLCGADWLAFVIARQLGWDAIGFPAQWEALGAGAGFARNTDMVKYGADLWLAFINACATPGHECPKAPHGSHGSYDCLAKVRKAGIPIVMDQRGW